MKNHLIFFSVSLSLRNGIPLDEVPNLAIVKPYALEFGLLYVQNIHLLKSQRLELSVELRIRRRIRKKYTRRVEGKGEGVKVFGPK